MENINIENEEKDIMISIYCLAYNHEKYIRETLEGFLMQKTSYKFEVIVHDDCSTDSTPDIIREYVDKYSDIIKPIFQKENQYSKGVDIVSEYIFPKINGKYIAVCEGDDYWCDDNKLQIQVDFLESHPEYSACVHNTKFINCLTGKEGLKSVFRNNRTVETEDIIKYNDKVFHISSIMYRKKYMIMPNAFHARGFGDYPRSIYLSMVGKIYYFDNVMSVYHMLSTEDSWSYRNYISKNEKKMILNTKLEVNRLLSEIDKYSNGKYHYIINEVRRENNFKILNIQGNYKKAYKEYKDLVNQFTAKERLVFLLKVYIPYFGYLCHYVRRNVKAIFYKILKIQRKFKGNISNL